MSYRYLGEAEQPSISLEDLAAKQDEMFKVLRESENRRKLGGYIAVLSGVFAAFRLGILALPAAKEKYAEIRSRRAASPR